MARISFSFLLGVFILLAMKNELAAQERPGQSINFEFQAYPTGLIPGIRYEKNFKTRNSWHVRLGYNWIRHRDLGKHDDERGDGFGFTLGFKRYFNETFTGWHVGIRNDFWWNSLDWMNDGAGGSGEFGNTDITVLQPTAELGYLLTLGDSMHFTPTVSFGWEWNVKTTGDPTGEGAILLLGVQVGHLF